MKVKKPNVDVAVHLSRGDKFVSEGRFDDGLIAYQIALEADPGNPLVYTSIGSVLELMGQFEDAVVAYQCSIKVCPNTTLSRFKMGCALHALGRARAAKAAFYACIRLNPDHVAAYNNLGIIEKALGDHAAALKNYSMAVELDPSFAKARDNLGLLFIAMGQPEDARAVYQESIDRELVDSRAEHLLAALMQDGQSVIPQTYVQQLFDDCAHTFEHHLVNTLNYQSPQILDAMLAQEICPPNPEDQIPFLTGLDLGCGTGLMGPILKRFTTRFDGVDLSKKMVLQAARKKLYNELYNAELVEFLQRRNGLKDRYDLVVAADVFNYFGDLSAVFQGVRARMNSTGRFAFSVEARDADTYALNPSGRYTHSPTYIEALATESGFKIVTQHVAPMRTEQGVETRGLYYVLCCLPIVAAPPKEEVKAYVA